MVKSIKTNKTLFTNTGINTGINNESNFTFL